MLIGDTSSTIAARHIGLLLIDGFALMSYASVIEPFRAANTLAGREVYRWTHISIDGRHALASNGASISADCAVGEPIACDTVFVFAAGDPAAFSDAKTFAWLRQLAHSNVRLAGVSGGPFILARAGVLAGYRATIHWDHQTAFIDAFPTLAFESSLYVIDRRRLTCAGGTAGLDLAVELIEREQGQKLAAKVSEWFIRTESRSASKPQRLSLRERFGIKNDQVLRVLSEMEMQLEKPAARKQLAKVAGVSVRQLERLFAAHLRVSVDKTYLHIRLEKADELLRKTGLSVLNIGLACGFQSSSHFSRAFKARYSISPRAQRQL